MWPFKSKRVEQKALQSVDERGWLNIFDWRPGAWQSDATYDSRTNVNTFPPIFACLTLISGDIGKLSPGVQAISDGIWADTTHDASKVLSKPNPFQNHIQFKEYWITSKLQNGNTFVLKTRDGRGKVVGLFILDPAKVTPLVSDGGEVFYRLNEDNLSGLKEGQIIVPATEIIHDRHNCLDHPLVGLPPLYACAVSGGLGLEMQSNVKAFFKNGSSPSGILTAPGHINDETAKRLKTLWNEGFQGEKSGRVAVAGDGLEYKPLRMSNVDAQLLEILKLTAETVCSVFHVPAYMVGVGSLPTYNNIEALTQQYYGQCLQKHIEAMELCLYEGLEIAPGFRVQLDLDGLFRMDSKTLIETLEKGVGGGIMAPNEARKRVNLPPKTGGNSVYMQQQDFSLEALAARDATNPLAAVATAPPAVSAEDSAKLLAMLIEKELKNAA